MKLVLALLGSTLAAQYGAPRVIATVNIPQLAESSGIAASRTHPGVFWSHNDSGGGSYVYAFDRQGKSKGRWRLAGARAWDWEDMAVGPGPKRGAEYLYVGDIGDNNRNRKEVIVYRAEAPKPGSSGGTIKAAAIPLAYPDGPHDAEALMVHPSTGDIYIVTKAKGGDTATGVYKATAPHGSTRRTMQRLAEIDLPGISPFTLIIGRIVGGDISPDGKRVVLCDYFRAYEAVLPEGKSFDAVWTAGWRDVGIGQRRQGEAICYRHDGKAILVTSEGRDFPLIEVVRDR